MFGFTPHWIAVYINSSNAHGTAMDYYVHVSGSNYTVMRSAGWFVEWTIPYDIMFTNCKIGNNGSTDFLNVNFSNNYRTASYYAQNSTVNSFMGGYAGSQMNGSGFRYSWFII